MLILLIALLPLMSCASGSGSVADSPAILGTVPSDAVLVCCNSRLNRALAAVLDSTDVLRRVEYGSLGSSRAVLSYSNLGKSAAILAIDAGKAASDTSSSAASVLAQASRLKLFSKSISAFGRNILLLSPSETEFTQALRHIDSKTSILDAPQFGTVLREAGDNFLVLRNSGIPKLVNCGALSFLGLDSARKALGGRAFTSFLQNSCDYVVMSGFATGDDIHVSFVQSPAKRTFSTFLASIEDSPCRLVRMGWPQPEYAYSIAVGDVAKWRKAREALLDSQAQMGRYNDALRRCKSSSGKDPAAVERQLGVREVACFVYDNYKIALLRVCSSFKKEPVIEPNPCPGFASALYGSAFDAGDTHYVRIGEVIALGSEEALSAFLESIDDPASVTGQAIKVRAEFVSPKFTLACTSAGNKMTINAE